MLRLWPELLAPENASSGSSKETSVNDMIDFMDEEESKSDKGEVLDLKEDKGKKDKEKDEEDEKQDDTDTEDEGEEEKEENEQEEEDELETIKEELEEKTEEDLDDDDVLPVSRREILAKYPKIFKEFPYLERAYYREREYADVFPTVKEAKEAVGKIKTLDNFENELAAGKLDKILLAVKQYNPNALNKIADDYMSTLASVDTGAYHHVIGNLIKDTVVAMVQEAKASGNESLQAAATVLHQFIFGSSDWKPKTKLSKEDDDKDDRKVSEKEIELNKREFERARTTVNTGIEKTLTTTIEAFIDPRETMTPYVRKHAINEVMETVSTALEKDRDFQRVIVRAWKKAESEDYSDESIGRIRRAYIAKAKTLMPTAIKKARNEALRGMGKRVIERDDSESDEKESSLEKKEYKSEKKSSRSTTPINSGKSDKERAKNIPQNMSSLDYLMQD